MLYLHLGFDPAKAPASDSPTFASYDDDSAEKLMNHYGANQPAETVESEEYIKQSLIILYSEIQTE